MPCNGGYPKPTKQEIRRKEANDLLIYVCRQMGYKLPGWIIGDSEHPYGDKATVELCNYLRQIKSSDPGRFEELVYNARSKQSRRLADWWEQHELEDQAREAAERQQKERDEAVVSLLGKLNSLGLTDQEEKLLGEIHERFWEKG